MNKSTINIELETICEQRQGDTDNKEKQKKTKMKNVVKCLNTHSQTDTHTDKHTPNETAIRFENDNNKKHNTRRSKQQSRPRGEYHTLIEK